MSKWFQDILKWFYLEIILSLISKSCYDICKSLRDMLKSYYVIGFYIDQHLSVSALNVHVFQDISKSLILL